MSIVLNPDLTTSIDSTKKICLTTVTTAKRPFKRMAKSTKTDLLKTSK